MFLKRGLESYLFSLLFKRPRPPVKSVVVTGKPLSDVTVWEELDNPTDDRCAGPRLLCEASTRPSFCQAHCAGSASVVEAPGRNVAHILKFMGCVIVPHWTTRFDVLNMSYHLKKKKKCFNHAEIQRELFIQLDYANPHFV